MDPRSRQIDDRRYLMKAAAATTAVAAFPQAPAPKKMIGIQAGVVSFVDQGVERVLDIFQERAGINTLFLAVFIDKLQERDLNGRKAGRVNARLMATTSPSGGSCCATRRYWPGRCSGPKACAKPMAGYIGSVTGNTEPGD